MSDGKHEFLLQRHVANPILTAADWPHTVNAVFNPAAVLLPDGTTLLLCRVEDRRGISCLWAARSENGIDDWRVDAEPVLLPDPEHHPEELWGVEDPRIVWLDELGQYGVTYTAYSRAGPAVSLALTRDFVSFERLGVVMPPDDKDAALLPRRFDGNWLMLHRPQTGLGSAIWMAESPDLQHWGKHQVLMAARSGAWWDGSRIGLGSPLIETEQGWLMIYHGTHQTAAGSLYRLGVALLDREDPRICIARGSEWILGPSESYERLGDVGDVVFTCGHTIGSDGDSIHLYYGGADTCIALAFGRVSEILAWLARHGSAERGAPPAL